MLPFTGTIQNNAKHFVPLNLKVSICDQMKETYKGYLLNLISIKCYLSIGAIQNYAKRFSPLNLKLSIFDQMKENMEG